MEGTTGQLEARERSTPAADTRDRPWEVWCLLAAAGLLLLTGLGAPDLWTLEERWALICQEMLRSDDYVHPRLVDGPYYDKPLLSYWLMVGLAWVLGSLDGWALRLPSALSGLVTVWCTWRLGRRFLGRQAGLLAGLMLATSFYFIFWGRVASADMLTVAGVTAAVTWFVERRDRGFLFYLVWFSILALTSLTKGLIGAVIPILVLSPSLFRERSLLRATTVLAALCAGAIYLVPFLLSGGGGGELGMWGGLNMVFRENVLRFFAPFDHRENFFTYCWYLPLFFLPWTVFLPWAAWSAARGWKRSGPGTRWAARSSLMIFAFLTASGSRRGYYVLPLLPFVALLTAGWICPPEGGGPRRRKAASWLAAASGVVLFGWFGLARPAIPEIAGLQHLAREVHEVMARNGPPGSWQYVFWQKQRGANAFYLSPHHPGEWIADGGEGLARLRRLLAENPRTAVVTTRKYRQEVLPLLSNPLEIEKKDWGARLARVEWLPASRRPSRRDENVVVVLLPRLE